MSYHCPHCGKAIVLASLSQDADWRAYCQLLSHLPPGVAYPLQRYLELFTPARQVLRPGRMLRLASELIPMIDKGQVVRHRTAYACPPEQWARAMLYLVDSPPATLRLPLKDNGYLLGMLANRCERVAARAEAGREAGRRNRGSGSPPGMQRLSDLLSRQDVND